MNIEIKLKFPQIKISTLYGSRFSRAFRYIDPATNWSTIASIADTQSIITPSNWKPRVIESENDDSWVLSEYIGAKTPI